MFGLNLNTNQTNLASEASGRQVLVFYLNLIRIQANLPSEAYVSAASNGFLSKTIYKANRGHKMRFLTGKLNLRIFIHYLRTESILIRKPIGITNTKVSSWCYTGSVNKASPPLKT